MNFKTRVSRAMLAATMMTSAVVGVGATADAAPAAPAGGERPGVCEQNAGNQGFGTMFPGLAPATYNDSDLSRLGEFILETEHKEGSSLRGTTDEARNIDAGYTYAGQFMVHDITADNERGAGRPSSDDLRTPVDPMTLTNFRTNALDLDSIYGGGPTDSPELYEADGMTFKLGELLGSVESDKAPRDLFRDSNTGRAILGDSRNDENRITASMASSLFRFHNRAVESMSNSGLSNDVIFASARQATVHHYQWAMLDDFLPTVVRPSVLNSIVTRSGNQWNTNLRFYQPCMNIPFEFNIASQRFGHSMVRDDYDINESAHSIPIFASTFDPNESLVGFQPSPQDFAIDWDLFFDQEDHDGDGEGEGSAQQAYKIDASLVPQLRLLPLPETGLGPAELAHRNLLRSQQVGLPSGQDIARAMGLKPLYDDQIIIGPAIDEDDTVAITDLGQSFRDNAPLWVYTMAEPVNYIYDVHHGHIPDHADEGDWFLGEVSGRIVAETIVGLLENDPTSILNVPFQPQSSFLDNNGNFGLRELFNESARYVGPVSNNCWNEEALAEEEGARERFYVTNNSDQEVVVYRIDEEGERHFEETIRPGRTESDGSHIGVNLVFTIGEGSCFDTSTFAFDGQEFIINPDLSITGRTGNVNQPNNVNFPVPVVQPAAPVPTATAVPVPTATAVPVPTATAVPVPTATAEPRPTATAEPRPTATTEPRATAIPPQPVTDEELRQSAVNGVVSALEAYGRDNGTYAVAGGGFRGAGSGWVNFERAGTAYTTSTASVLERGGYLAPGVATANPTWSSSSIVRGDLLIYRCQDRVAVFTLQGDGVATAEDQQWWADNGCTTYPLDRLNAAYFKLSTPLR